jgi:NAD(P)-dependent dehydrogenase (short-subunit alcohol dehydrogenase family)
MKLRNRVVVITGAASGIGRASARRFAERGAILHLVDLDAERLEAAAVECSRLGARSAFHVADCRDPKAQEQLAKDVLARDAVVDVLFLNAGIGYGGNMADMTLGDWRLVLDTNLFGVVHGLGAFLRPMLAQRSGHILITASMLGLFSMPQAGAYAASKHALVAIAESLRTEVRPKGIEVTALCPGLVATDIIRRGHIQHDAKRAEKIWDRFGADPDVVARFARDCVEHGRGGVRPIAATGASLWRLQRFAPRLYERTLLAIGRLRAT